MNVPPPLPFQKEDILTVEARGLRSLISWDMGLGKTFAALGCLHRNPDALPALVVCPAPVKYMWESEAARFGIRAAVAEGRRPPAYSRLLADERMVIINYDILPYWADWLRHLGFRTMVLDECQNIGNLESRRTQAALRVGDGIPHVLALSGTPLTNRPAELWPTLNLIRPDLFPSFWTFACDHCEPRMIKGRWHYGGAKNLPELNRRLADVMVRRRKKDVLSQLPSKRREVIPVPLSDRGLYDQAEEDFLGWLRTEAAEKVRSAGRAEAMTRVGYLLRLAARLKLRFVIDWVNEYLRQTDDKIVLFAVHRKCVEALTRRVEFESVVVDGTVAGRARKMAVDKFRRDGRVRALIGNVKAAGTGIDGLQEVCQTAAFVEMWWAPGTMIQAEDRIHRIGQQGSAQILYFVARGTVEERVAQTIQRKQYVIDQTLDGQTAAQGLDIFDLFLRSMIKGAT